MSIAASRGQRGVGWILALGLVLGLSARADDHPSVVLEEDLTLTLRDLPGTLEHESVAPQLDSGLTTTLLFRVALSTPRTQGAARIQIRYELWDEEYLVELQTARDPTTHATYASQDALRDWWNELEIPVLKLETPPPAPQPLQVELQIIPFSVREASDTQRWLEQSLRSSGLRGEMPQEVSATEPESSLERIFEVLLATSIRRRASSAWQWRVTLQTEPP